MKPLIGQPSPSRDAGALGPRREAEGSGTRPSVVSRSATAFCFVEPQRGEMFLAPGPLHPLPFYFSAARRQPRAESATWLAQSKTLARWRGRLKVAKRRRVRQSPAAFPRRRVEKVVSGRDVQDNGTTGQRDNGTTGQRDDRTTGLWDYRTMGLSGW
jgi:hypothetical protein